MTPSPGIEPGPDWWEASALTLRQPCSTFQLKSTEQYFLLLLFALPYKKVLTFESYCGYEYVNVWRKRGSCCSHSTFLRRLCEGIVFSHSGLF